MKTRRFAMLIDVDRCNGCGACMVACAVENNVPPAPPSATDRTGITPMRVYAMSNGEAFPQTGTAFVPIMCQQCGEETPCATVCPQQAVELDPETGIVFQMAQRCLGCRYCMTACPYHARYFNWHDPLWPAGMERTLNPNVAPRMRGVVEKCNFCHGRFQTARAQAASEGKRDVGYTPACVESCPTEAISFGDLDDPGFAAETKAPEAFRFLPRLGTEPKVYYKSKRGWVRNMAQNDAEVRRG